MDDQNITKQCFISAMKIESPSKLIDHEQLQIDDAEMEIMRDEMDEITFEDRQEIKNTKPLEEVTSISIHPDYPDCHA